MEELKTTKLQTKIIYSFQCPCCGAEEELENETTGVFYCEFCDENFEVVK